MAELLALETLTADASKASCLERMLGNNAASYKYYWFKGVLDQVCAGRTKMTFTRLVARMASGAWYPIAFFRLSLGASDKLADLVDYLQTACGMSRDSSKEKIVAVVEEGVTDDARLKRFVDGLTQYVPYRIICPFYEDELRCERLAVEATGRKWYYPMTDAAILRANLENPEKAIYDIASDRSWLEVSPDWAHFLRENDLDTWCFPQTRAPRRSAGFPQPSWTSSTCRA